jgi:multicomponent K+:H+ antiporter subunit G
MAAVTDFIVAALVLAGAAFALIGSFGLAKLSTIYTRLHGPTKASTLGVGCILIGSALHFSMSGTGVSLHELTITLFLFITAPVSAHLIIKAAMKLDPSARPAPPAAPAQDDAPPR